MANTRALGARNPGSIPGTRILIKNGNGVWRSLLNALGLGPRDPGLESQLPDQFEDSGSTVAGDKVPSWGDELPSKEELKLRLTYGGYLDEFLTASLVERSKVTGIGAVWFSALAWGARGPRFESGMPDLQVGHAGLSLICQTRHKYRERKPSRLY